MCVSVRECVYTGIIYVHASLDDRITASIIGL